MGQSGPQVSQSVVWPSVVSPADRAQQATAVPIPSPVRKAVDERGQAQEPVLLCDVVPGRLQRPSQLFVVRALRGPEYQDANGRGNGDDPCYVRAALR